MAGNTKSGAGRKGNRSKKIGKLVDVVMDGMTKEEEREFFIKCVGESSLDDLKRSFAATEAYFAKHAAEIDDSDKALMEDVRRIYADAIAIKENERAGHRVSSFIAAALVIVLVIMLAAAAMR
jgi:hypothetical protein